MTVEQLLTSRLLLRPWDQADVPTMAAIYADPKVGEWVGGVIGIGETGSRIQASARQWEERGFGVWAVEEQASGRLVGRTGFTHWDEWTASPHDAEIGWTFSSAVWGRGYATEAASAALSWARRRSDLRQIISITVPHNRRSRRVMDKLGFSYQGEALWRGFLHVWYGQELAADPETRLESN